MDQENTPIDQPQGELTTSFEKTAQPSQAQTEDEQLRNLFPSMTEGDVPPMDAPEDEDLATIRSEWAYFPAEVNKRVPSGVFDAGIGKTFDTDDGQVTMTRGMALKAVAELRAVVGDMGMNAEEAEGFMASIKTAVKGPSTQDPIPGRETAVEMLNREHGDSAAEALRAARAYISKNPKLGRLLDRTGLGDDPTTVATIARRALTLHRSGKLRLK